MLSVRILRVDHDCSSTMCRKSGECAWRKSGAFVICVNRSWSDVAKSCLEFVAAWKSEYINCFTCVKWNREDLVCMDPDEVARRRRANELGEINKLINGNKPVAGPL